MGSNWISSPPDVCSLLSSIAEFLTEVGGEEGGDGSAGGVVVPVVGGELTGRRIKFHKK